MDIYDENKQLDLEKATRALPGVSILSGDRARQESFQELQAAALLDIAGSLRVLATESSLAMQGAGYAVGDRDEAEDYEESELDLGSFVTGLTADHAHGQMLGTIVELSESEGDVVASVEWEDGTFGKPWLKVLRRPTDQERHEHLGREAVRAVAEQRRLEDEEQARLEAELNERDAAALVDDDIDADFDEPSSPPDALAALRAKQGKKKSGKK